MRKKLIQTAILQHQLNWLNGSGEEVKMYLKN